MCLSLPSISKRALLARPGFRRLLILKVGLVLNCWFFHYYYTWCTNFLQVGVDHAEVGLLISSLLSLVLCSLRLLDPLLLKSVFGRVEGINRSGSNWLNGVDVRWLLAPVFICLQRRMLAWWALIDLVRVLNHDHAVAVVFAVHWIVFLDGRGCVSCGELLAVWWHLWFGHVWYGAVQCVHQLATLVYDLDRLALLGRAGSLAVLIEWCMKLRQKASRSCILIQIVFVLNIRVLVAVRLILHLRRWTPVLDRKIIRRRGRWRPHQILRICSRRKLIRWVMRKLPWRHLLRISQVRVDLWKSRTGIWA